MGGAVSRYVAEIESGYCSSCSHRGVASRLVRTRCKPFLPVNVYGSLLGGTGLHITYIVIHKVIVHFTLVHKFFFNVNYIVTI